MGVWSVFYNPDERFRPNLDRSPEWNRGAYLAEGLAHCGDCHTPRNLAQAPDNRRKFAGTVIDGWRAYNITSDAVSGVGSWSDEELLAYLRSGHATGHGSAGGPMAEVVDVSLSKLLPSDLRALVAYLRSIPAVRTRDLPARRTTPALESFASAALGSDRKGKQMFEGACAACHGWTGHSPVTRYATLTGSRGINDPSATNVVQVLLSGQHRDTPTGVVFMPAFGAAYSNSEIAAVANYVTERFGATPSQLTAEDVARVRK
jgi:mono/diheme cytochrome c family protein